MAVSLQDSRTVAAIKIAASLYARLAAQVDRKVDRSLGTKTERRVITHLALVPESTDAEVVKALGLQPSQGSGVFPTLEKQGLIVAKGAPRHKLQRLWSLSPEGLKRADKIRVAVSAAMEDVLATFSPEERLQVFEASGLRALDQSNRGLSGPVDYRPFEFADWPALLSMLTNAGIPERRGNFIDAVGHVAEFANEGPDFKLSWVACHDKELLGCCLAIREKNGMIGRIVLCFVLPKARGNGLASALIEKCVARCSELSLTSVRALALADSPLARALKSNAFELAPIAKNVSEPEPLRNYIRNLALLGTIFD